MSQAVKLYVYDLSNGMARQLSRQLTGRQIDGIWHTSVVVFGKEIFYGQGISVSQPGRSHHGTPLQVIDMGETAIDEETFNDYVSEMNSHYTADKYHLLDFNCNSFTNDCIGFLTGGSIPPFIKDLPTDFLSTPFGASLRPTIDAMYRRPTPGAASIPATTSPNPQLASSILQSVASRAASGDPSYLPTPAPTPTPATQTLTAPIHISTNPTSLHSLLKANRAVVALFTAPATCPPCRVIEPVFDNLAKEKSREGLAFSKIDLDVGMGQNVAREWSVRVTPTFIFFLDGNKIYELKGADAGELRTQVDLLIFQAFPPHSHTSLSLRSTTSISLAPILFTQVPNLDAVSSKLVSFIQASPARGTLSEAGATLQKSLIPFLKLHFQKPVPPNAIPATSAKIASWASATSMLVNTLQLTELFPLVDIWRLASLNPGIGAWLASTPDPVLLFINKALDTSASIPRNYTLTVLRMLANAFSSEPLARKLLISRRGQLTGILVPSLLHEDASVRTAAASLAFNAAALTQKGRQVGTKADEGDGDWEVEMISAIVEAIQREEGSEEVVHRLTASLALLLYMSPFYEAQHSPLLEVLQTRDALKGKLNGKLLVKREVRALVEEVSGKLCP